jgi:hypothetical protein
MAPKRKAGEALDTSKKTQEPGAKVDMTVYEIVRRIHSLTRLRTPPKLLENAPPLEKQKM